MTKTKKAPNNAAVNVSLEVHRRFVAFCDSRQPVAWPVGATAAKALEEFIQKHSAKRKSAAGGED